MNIVLYSDEMEPITVVKSPFTPRQMMALHLTEFQVVALPPASVRQYERPSGPTKPNPTLTVRVWMEPFFRNGVRRFFFFTDDDEAALLLRSEVLPGQQREHQEQFQKGFARGFVAALGRAL